jgi:gliding motility-associated-like protein
MKIVLTGSEGFIGSHLKKKLLRKKHQLICYDLSLNKDIKDFTLDGDENFVIHLAAKANVRDSVKNPAPYFITNTRILKFLFYAQDFSDGSISNGIRMFRTNLYRIYSRWGELVFQSENPETQWNGSYNGQYAPAGVYLYQLEMTTCDGPLKTTGNLTLIR